MSGLRNAAVLGCLVVCTATARLQAQLPVENVSASFPVGPYSTLYVDPLDPTRMALGTVTGVVAWSDNAGALAHESRAMSPRRFDAMALRSGSRSADLAISSTDDDQQQNSGRANRLFIAALNRGVLFARWAHWMALGDPYTEISSVAMPNGPGRMLAATPSGILLSDRGGHTWTRVLGTPGPLTRDQDPGGLAVTVNPQDPNHVLAGTTKGLWISRDGGFTYSEHPTIREEPIFAFLWDSVDPTMLMALSWGSILQSRDGGETFQVAYSTTADVFGVALGETGSYVATSEGLVYIDAEGTETRHYRNSAFVGVASLGSGAVAASETDLLLFSEQGESIPLAHTERGDPFLAVRGGPDLVWAITRNAVYRIGGENIARRHEPAPPVLEMTLPEVLDALHEYQGFGSPDSTRIHERWYSNLVPSITFNLIGQLREPRRISFDGIHYDLPYRESWRGAHAQVEFVIEANWDLSQIVFGDNSNFSNPMFLLERSLRENREAIVDEVQTRYTESAALIRALATPPIDAAEHTLMRMRLEEHAAYLEALTGRTVVRGEEL